MNRKQKKRKLLQLRCPYCGSIAVLRSAEGIYPDDNKNRMLYVCKNYPQCDAYVNVHAGTNIPMGSLADHELRSLRKKAHQYFDRLYLSGLMSREDAYVWLSELLAMPLSEAHIGHLGEYYCQLVCKECDKLLHDYRHKVSKCTYGPMHEGGVRVR